MPDMDQDLRQRCVHAPHVLNSLSAVVVVAVEFFSVDEDFLESMGTSKKCRRKEGGATRHGPGDHRAAGTTGNVWGVVS